MNNFLTKIAMLVMFLLAVTSVWAALEMVFPVNLVNILLGVVGAFFLLRAFELADKVNKLGPYADPEDKKTTMQPGPPHHGPRFGEGNPGTSDDDESEITPDEE